MPYSRAMLRFLKLPATKQALAWETLLLLGNYLGNVMIGLVATVIITRTLGPELRGVYAWILTLQVIGVQVAMLVPYNTVRQMGSAEGEKAWPRLAGTFTALTVLGCIFTIPIFAWALWQPVGHTYMWLVLMAWLAVPVAALAGNLSGLVHLRASPQDVLLPTFGMRAATTTLALAAWFTGLISIGVALWLVLFSAVILLVVFAWRLDIPFRKWRVDRALARRAGKFWGATWLSSLILFVVPKVVFIILPHYGGMAALGYYSIASTVFDLALTLPTAATSVLISHFARAESTAKARWHVLGVLTVLMVGAAIAGYVLAPFMLPLLFGQAFMAAVGPFRVLMVALVLQAPLSVFISHLTAKTQGWGVLLPALAGLLVTTGVALALVPLHGTIGAAWAVVAGYAAQVLTSLGFYCKSRAYTE